ncbi:MAG: hydroxymethylglutaryl-CoA reductase, degradative [Bacteroidales bacterium]|nr:hydroxymethylglutaryl-CoA reductase, degradative [Bacteroidales bacterium]
MEESTSLRKRDIILKGFSKLLKEDKLKAVAEYIENPSEFINLLKSFWYQDDEKQKQFDEFSENTISNYHVPYGVSPNVIINGKSYVVPMVIEESSVVAAASAAAKFWGERGGFHAEIVDVKKVGQVHFCWKGDKEILNNLLPEIKDEFLKSTSSITEKMTKRGGGIIDIQLIDYTDKIPDYYQFLVTFNTCDSMGANFINSILETFGHTLQDFFLKQENLEEKDRAVEIVMCILSNYTPECRVKVWVECPTSQLDGVDENLDGKAFAEKFKKAVDIALIDSYRAATHNKGIYNGIDAVVIATGNDFRATEAAGHSYAAKDGHYKSLSHVDIHDDMFRFTLDVPLALGTVGGLTSLHPLAKKSLELLGNPSAKELMMIAATMGLANNYAAVKSLTTKGIQQGHMKMHLANILNQLGANKDEKTLATEYFKDKTVSYSEAETFLRKIRS